MDPLITGELERLRDVVIHRPGPELDRMVPDNLEAQKTFTVLPRMYLGGKSPAAAPATPCLLQPRQCAAITLLRLT